MRNKEFYVPCIVSLLITVVLSSVVAYLNIIGGIICLLLAIVLISIFVYYTKRRYKKIEELNDYLSSVLRGDYSFKIETNEEGELSIISNNLYKVITELHNYSDNVVNDKINLSKSLEDISHQLKTPLTAIGVSTDILLSTLNGTKQEKFINVIDSETEKMTWLVQSILKLSKMDAGTIQMNMQEYNVHEIIDNVVSPFELMLELKNINLNLDLNDFSLKCDKNWLSESLRNIVKNAIEHLNDGGNINISAKEETLFSQIDISDTGSGIQEDDIPHIFERFYKAKNSSSESVGIGLALSQEIVNRHNGKIEVASKYGEGTRFTIKLYKGII